MSRLTRDGTAEPVFSGANGERGIFIFPVQLTTSRIGNLTRLIHNTLAIICDDHTTHTTSCSGKPAAEEPDRNRFLVVLFRMVQRVDRLSCVAASSQ